MSARLLLFDIDGTLLSCGRKPAQMFGDCLLEVFGTAGDLAGYDFGGKTDGQIVLELMTAAGLEAGEVHRRLPRMREQYLARLEAELSRESMRLMPGVEDTLDRLAGRGEHALALLTGNWEPGARSKLGRFDMNRHFPFGGFGDDGIERHELVPAALERAEAATGRRFAPQEALIIGDTVLDVACGKAHGVPVLAVATGRTSAARLAAAGADWVAADLIEAAGMLPELAG